MSDIEELIARHRSVRRFKPRELDREALAGAVRVAQCASTSSHVQGYSVIWVRDAAKRARLVELTGGQAHVAAAGAFLVICGDTRRHDLVFRRASRGIHHNLETFLLPTIDAALFAQNLALVFESRQLGVCFIGGLRDRLDDVDALLDLPSGVLPLFGMCVGEPDDSPAQLPRLPVAAVLFEDRYATDDALLAELDTFDEMIREFYGGRGKANRTWTGGLLRKFAAPLRAGLAAYYRAKGARFEA